ncbi:MAG TPA: TolC family protein [Gemmataceae bacterium]|nr:TolC family protein [Gemmataceae bacterium]
MGIGRIGRLALGLVGALAAGCVTGEGHLPTILAEQRDIAVRDPAQLPPAPLPPLPPPSTVDAPLPESAPPRELSLDQAIRTALGNSKVVRVLVGETAVASGQTIYDPAISNTRIDQEQAAFDPVAAAAALFTRSELGQPVLSPLTLAGADFFRFRTETAELSAGLAQRTPSGGIVGLDARKTITRSPGGFAVFDPLISSSAGVSLTQPLLRGAGVDVNLAPVVIARVNTERSFFQYKDAVQELVRGVVQAYWAVVAARVDAWVRRQQVEQGKATLERAEAREGFEFAAEVALARSSLATFEANLIAAEANVLQREATLRNLLGVPPSDPHRLVLTSSPSDVGVRPSWDKLLRLAEQRRPDIAELKLALEADEQRRVVAENQAQPQLDAVAGYRLGGLEGETPFGRVSTGKADLAECTVGVNFSVPLGLRQGRALLREAELTIARDRANLQQGLHAAAHDLAESVRSLAQAYAQVRAYRKTRALARESLEKQLDAFQTRRGALYLNVLQAIAEWGNAVSAEAQALAQYNTELANLERRTGTILDTHGVRFFEERFLSAGPLGKHGPGAEYPAAMPPAPNADRYPVSPQGPEAALERDKPKLPKGPGDGAPRKDLPPLKEPGPGPDQGAGADGPDGPTG